MMEKLRIRAVGVTAQGGRRRRHCTAPFPLLICRRSPSNRVRFRMANIKSQIKRNKTNELARRRNQSIRSEMKTRSRSALEAAEAGDAEEAKARLREAQKRIDTATAQGVLHKRTAARRKSRLARQVADLLDA